MGVEGTRGGTEGQELEGDGHGASNSGTIMIDRDRMGVAMKKDMYTKGNSNGTPLRGVYQQ